jgi:hypothetical protein
MRLRHGTLEEVQFDEVLYPSSNQRREKLLSEVKGKRGKSILRNSA